MLSTRGRYAIRALLFMARTAPDRLCKIAEISAAEAISYKFLSVILGTLKHHGIVESVRGKSGGYRLARPPAQISLGEILRVTDGPLVLSPCTHAHGTQRCDGCVSNMSCELRAVMMLARDRIAALLDAATLADPPHLPGDAISAANAMTPRPILRAARRESPSRSLFRER